ncbi:MAG: hypothetical protein F6K19_01790 [Cyanothece sp. SIO1E1]|nr:hypothetical protein [Cyanothece sp. SIO1E1]
MTDYDKMPFGDTEGHLLKDIPDKYWEWASVEFMKPPQRHPDRVKLAKYGKRRVNKIKIIGLAGKAGNGKDCVAKILNARKYDSKGVLWENRKYANKLKTICKILTGVKEQWSEEGKKTFVPAFGMTVREIQQVVGTDCLRDNLDKDVWVKALFADYDPKQRWVISDVRFPNEVNAIKERKGVVVKIERPDNDTEVPQHISETALDGHRFDYTIINDGSLDDLVSKTEEMLDFFDLL